MIVDAALKKTDQTRRELNSFLAINGEVPFLDDFPENTFYLLEVVRRNYLAARSNHFAHRPNPSRPGAEQADVSPALSMRRRRGISTLEFRGRSARRGRPLSVSRSLFQAAAGEEGSDRLAV